MVPHDGRERDEEGYEPDVKKSLESDTETITNIGAWPELSKYITAFHPIALREVKIEAKVNIHLTCDICQDRRLWLPHWIDGHSHLNTPEHIEELCVLPCGHFFGFNCIVKWTEQQKLDSVHPACPKCRFELIYPECEDPITLKPIGSLSEYHPGELAHIVPYTRVHRLQGDKKTFVDASAWSPDREDEAADNFGVPGQCYECEREKVLSLWETKRMGRW
ncbi:hypothetical protein NUW58_g4047 [Xylaria curta]|uniref:Uncharacterized protein n=1 Tax=Xylaria curta TaxID=42375 RepID=A0ACC1P9U3_9PEZI|nr:hypothetical protein NUW58_g4047 [Xylaria curta]